MKNRDFYVTILFVKAKAKYVFFDIECSNGYNICSFGYCIFDENLTLLEKKDIVINPESKFVLNKKGHPVNIELAYPYEYFLKQNSFPYFYGKIKDILTNKGLTVIGHSIQSDFYFLAFACKRYHLQSIKANGYDTQKIYKEYSKSTNVASLEHILEQLNISASTLTFHKSSDDAHASFLVLKGICEKERKSFEQILQEYSHCKVDSKSIISSVNTKKKYVGLVKLKKNNKKQLTTTLQ